MNPSRRTGMFRKGRNRKNPNRLSILRCRRTDSPSALERPGGHTRNAASRAIFPPDQPRKTRNLAFAAAADSHESPGQKSSGQPGKRASHQFLLMPLGSFFMFAELPFVGR